MADHDTGSRSRSRAGTGTGSRISSVGSAMAEPSRAEILAALASGRAHTAGELARWVGVAPSTTSSHLSRLVDAGLVTVEASGRHRYFRIASEEVAELLERIDAINLSETNAPERPKPGTEMSFARSCYDHLAGELGVQLYRSMIDVKLLEEMDQHPVVSPAGHEHFAGLGIDSLGLASKRRPITRRCLDWTQRRHHLGGALGAALLEQMLDRKWLRPGRDSRILKLTADGHQGLRQHFGIMVVQN
ncbi:MAG: ArsR/SmtB family transcription factor [Acidimicrobiales bacterium]